MKIDATKQVIDFLQSKNKIEIVSDADWTALMTFPAAAGTQSQVDAGTTKTTPGTVNAWLKVTIAGTVYFIPAYTSKTT